MIIIYIVILSYMSRIGDMMYVLMLFIRNIEVDLLKKRIFVIVKFDSIHTFLAK